MFKMIYLVVRELSLLIRENKMGLLLLLGAASGYALLIGDLYSGGTVQHIPVAVCDMDGSSLSRALTTEISTTDQLDLVAVTGSERDAESLVRDKTVLGAIIIPQGFARDAINGSASVAFVSNSSNNIHSSYAKSPISGVVAGFGAKLRAESLAAHGTPEIPVSLVNASPRLLYNETQSYDVFYIYGVMMAAAQVGLMISFGTSVYDDKHAGVFSRFGAERLLAAKEIVFLMLFHIAVLTGCFIVNTLFNLPYKPIFWAYFIMITGFGFCVMNMTALLACFFRTKVALMQCLALYTLSAFLCCGYIWPYLAMVPLVRVVSHLIPLHYLVSDMRFLFTSGEVPAFGANLFVLYASGFIMMTIAIWCISRRKVNQLGVKMTAAN